MITKMEAFSAQPSAPELRMAAGDLAANDPVHIRDIQGLGPVKAEISSTPLATGRGEVLQGSSVGKRNIVLTLGFNPDWEEQTIASLRHLLYAYFLPQQWCKLRFYSHEYPPIEIEGICETNEPTFFSQDPEIQVSILCHEPDFVDANATIIEGVVSDDPADEHEFTYSGTLPTGFELTIKATPARPAQTGLVRVDLKSYGVMQQFQAQPITVDAAKYFKLNSISGSRRVMNVAVADGVTTNLLSTMGILSVWPEIKPGKNQVSVLQVNPGMKWVLAYFARYGGL